MLVVIFWLCVSWIVYVFLGYPVLAFFLGRLIRRPVQKSDVFPSVTIVIAAYNEANHIEATVRNKLDQDYPADKLRVIVVSDESEDGTDSLVSAIDENLERFTAQGHSLAVESQAH